MMRGSFDFHKVCRDHNLDPDQTSLHAAECLYLGIPPSSSICALAAVKRGLPANSSLQAVEDAGGLTPMHTTRITTWSHT